MDNLDFDFSLKNRYSTVHRLSLVMGERLGEVAGLCPFWLFLLVFKALDKQRDRQAGRHADKQLTKQINIYLKFNHQGGSDRISTTEQYITSALNCIVLNNEYVIMPDAESVSYTHLTLPTNREV